MRRSTLFVIAVLALLVIGFLLMRDTGPSGSRAGKKTGGGGAGGRAATDPSAGSGDGRRQLPPVSPFRKEFEPSMSASGSLVRGRVVDASSREAVPYVDVTFKQGRAELSANSGSSGEFEIELTPGTYRVRAVGEKVIAASQAPVTVGRADGLVVEVEVVRLAIVRGKVVYPDGGPAGGAIVGPTKWMYELQDYVKSGEIAATEARSDGSFELSLPPGNIELRASDGVTDGFVQVADLEGGSERDGVTITIDPSGAVEGFVALPDGSPAAGAEVMISARIPRTVQFDRYYADADASGRFSYDRLRPGEVVVEAAMSGYGPAEPVDFELEPGGRRRGIELTLTDGATITGRVVDANGDPLEDVEVSRVWIGSKYKFEKVTTGADGSFLFTGCGPGPHMVRARKRGYVDVQRRDVMAPAEAIVLQMPFAGGVDGTIESTGGAAVRRFVIEVRKPKQPRGQIKRFFTENGRYEVFPLNPGSYDVVIRAPKFEEALVEGVDVKGGEYTSVDATLKPL